MPRFDRGRVAHEAPRGGADQHLAWLGGLLEPRRDVDGVAGDERVAFARDHLARVDTDAGLQAELTDRGAHLPGGAHCAQGIILARYRHTKHRHHRVADELLDGAAVAFEDRAHFVVVAAHRGPQCFGVGAVAERRRAGEIAEDDCHDLPHFARGGGGGERRAAVSAELEAVRVLLTAGCADPHRTNLLGG